MDIAPTRRTFGPLIASIAACSMQVPNAFAQGSGPSENIRLFKEIIERGFNRGDLSVADEVCSERLVEHEYLSKTDVPGPEILKDQIQTARRNITGLSLKLEDYVESGDTVWGRSIGTGTHSRSGKTVSFTVIDICRFEKGKLVEHWGVPDRFALLHQIGALPPPPKP